VKQPVKVLIIEDSEDDAKLALRALRHGGFDPTHRRVQTATELETALAQERWDAVIADFMMPGFTGIEALGIFRASGLDIPFILVSGTIGEESAVDAMKAGASDYVMKNSLVRLAPALERELKESQIRAAHHRAQSDLIESERRFRDMLGNVGLISVMLDTNARITYCNDYFLQLTGWQRDEVIGRDWFEIFMPPETNDVKDKFAALLANQPEAWHHENEILTRSGERRLIRWNNSVLRSGAGDVIGTASIGEDITERKMAEAVLAQRSAELERFHRLSVGRELQMIELKKQINELAKQAGQRPPYDLAFVSS
jgi:PAS domain S-box-containing protein